MNKNNIKWKQIINEYRNKYITRQIIAYNTGYSINHINKMLKYHNVRIWDPATRNIITREMGRRIRNEIEYKSIEEIAKEYNINYSKIAALVKRIKRENKPEKKEIIKDNSKYYVMSKDRSPYARMIYEYNK